MESAAGSLVQALAIWVGRRFTYSGASPVRVFALLSARPRSSDMTLEDPCPERPPALSRASFPRAVLSCPFPPPHPPYRRSRSTPSCEARVWGTPCFGASGAGASRAGAAATGTWYVALDRSTGSAIGPVYAIGRRARRFAVLKGCFRRPSTIQIQHLSILLSPLPFFAPIP